MDKTLIWLLIPGTLAIFFYIRVSARHGLKSYDLEEYMLAGKRLARRRFILATTSVSFLGLMVLPHMGLFYRSGFSYGFTALAAIIVPLASALFARRLWILGRIYSPLTPAALLGDYYRSGSVRALTTIIAILVALSLTIMSLRFGAGLVEGLLGGHASLSGTVQQGGIITPLMLLVMAALLFYHAAIGGMGAILRIAAPIGVALVVALVVAALIAIDALGGFGSFFDHLSRLQQDKMSTLFTQGAFFDAAPAAAPTNMSWPGIMVASSLVALLGLATAPAMLMTSFTAAKGQSHAPAQFYAGALLTGFIMLTTTIIIALAAHLAREIPGLVPDQLGSALHPLKAGNEPKMILQLLIAAPLGAPLVLGLITIALICALLSSAAVSLLAAGGMISNDIFHDKLTGAHQIGHRKSITRYAIGLLVIGALIISWRSPDDPLPLFLLAGSFGVQLVPALAGLCYFKNLTRAGVRNGILAGLAAVLATSSIPQGLANLSGLSMPFGAWPLSLHPAAWGLGANLCLVVLTSILAKAASISPGEEKQLEHQRSFHVLPDGQPLMSKDANFWRLAALLIGVAFLVVTALPLTGSTYGELFPASIPSLWIWQFLSWFIGLALVYVVAYKLQPTFDPELAMDGSLNPQKRRFRVKAPMRKIDELPQQDTKKK